MDVDQSPVQVVSKQSTNRSVNPCACMYVSAKNLRQGACAIWWWRHSCTLADLIDAVVTVLVCLVAGAFVVECSLVEGGGAGSARGGAAQTVRVVNALAVLRLLRLARLGRTEPRVLALVHTAQAIAPFFLRFLRLLFFVALLFAVRCLREFVIS